MVGLRTIALLPESVWLISGIEIEPSVSAKNLGVMFEKNILTCKSNL